MSKRIGKVLFVSHLGYTENQSRPSAQSVVGYAFGIALASSVLVIGYDAFGPSVSRAWSDFVSGLPRELTIPPNWTSPYDTIRYVSTSVTSTTIRLVAILAI